MLLGSSISKHVSAAGEFFPLTSVITRKTKREIQVLCTKSIVHHESLKVLEWDKLCDSVASFARSPLGRDATKAQLWSLDQTFEDSLKLLQETNACIEMHKHGGFALDLTSLHLSLVKSAIQHARRALPLEAKEGIAVASLLLFVDDLQLSLKGAIKQDADWYTRFMPVTKMIMQQVVNRSLIKSIQQVIDDDGSVKDSASPALKRSRDQVRILERKLYQLMDSLIRNKKNEESFLEVSNIDGRWCIKSGADQIINIKGLLLSRYLRARESVAKAETDVLLVLTGQMQMDLDEIEMMLNFVIQLDVINARATYSLSFGGACPDIFLPDYETGSLTPEDWSEENKKLKALYPKREWILYLPKTYHPLLLQQHRQNVRKARKDVSDATAVSYVGPNASTSLSFIVFAGLHVLSSESARIPWFDSVFADVGDEQSLSQSLSTFSGHLKQISDIQSHSTSRSLVLLDEVGAGTNPLEGAALGMSLLEAFAESALLTIATTHHEELKTLKYSNAAFENACMEFDEVNLKPTYKILWGIPGRSNAINIAERLGLPSVVIDNARELYGDASAEINEVIISMERFKQEYQELLHETRKYLMLSRDLHENLLLTKKKIMEHSIDQRQKKMREISAAGARARSLLHRKLQQLRASSLQRTQLTAVAKGQKRLSSYNQHVAIDKEEYTKSSSSLEVVKQSPPESPVKRTELPKVGDTVLISSLGKRAAILKIDPSKEEIEVQAGNMKLKLKLADVET
ncbi:uncharacterized protein LOC110823288 [Carica papaya]|uniref:uncharacterized protein LOC110823288 n=1 Tax=Carica papaya TaxID=3649 RepID=UPI000B8D0B30|nr:uncharacterized protein LOC110823288 [Carica papaya]